MDTVRQTIRTVADNDWVKLVVLAVVIYVIAFVIIPAIISLFKGEKFDNYDGFGIGSSDMSRTEASTSGSKQRRLGVEMSQPSQGEHTTVHNPERAEWRKLRTEYDYDEDMVPGRVSYNGWEIDEDLDDYQHDPQYYLNKTQHFFTAQQEEEAALAGALHGSYAPISA